MPLIAEHRKKKISATLSQEMINRVAEYQKDAGLPSFSAALEELLWRQMMEEKAREYYSHMSDEEREEQRIWAQFATEQAAKTLTRE